MTSNDDYILEILENVGLISREQAVAARQIAAQDDEPVMDVLAREGTVSKLDMLKALAGQFGMETITLTGLDIPREVLDMVPGDVAQRYKVVPVFKHESVLTVALGDPLDVDTLDGLRYVLKCNVEGVVAPPEEIEKAIANYYGRATGAVEGMLQEITEGTLALPDDVKKQLVGDENVTESDAPIIKLVSLIIMEAFRSRASDIHLEPMPKKFRVRYRIDGVLHEVDSPPKRLQSAIISRVKIMAQLNIAEVSGGMARRVALARAIALDPELIMYDEPFTGLDPIAMGVTANLIRKLNDATGATSLIVSHDVDECFAICDRAYLLSGGGRVVAHGTPAELRASTDPEVRQFIGGEPDGPVRFHYPAAPLAQDLGLRA